MKNPAAFLGTEKLYNIHYLLSNSEKSVIILFMKRKIIIGIACALLAVCTAVGAFQHLKNSSSKDVTELSSTDITVQETAESEIPSEETAAVSPTDLPAETSTVAKTQKKIETSSAERAQGRTNTAQMFPNISYRPVPTPSKTAQQHLIY